MYLYRDGVTVNVDRLGNFEKLMDSIRLAWLVAPANVKISDDFEQAKIDDFKPRNLKAGSCARLVYPFLASGGLGTKQKRECPGQTPFPLAQDHSIL